VLPAAELGGSPSDYSIDELASIYPDVFFQTAEAATAVCGLQPGYTGAGAGRVRQLQHAQP
jgi:hypothetical protein